jgi:hypothetical protein
MNEAVVIASHDDESLTSRFNLKMPKFEIPPTEEQMTWEARNDDHEDANVFVAVVSNFGTIANTSLSYDLISNSIQAFKMEESNEVEQALVS